MCLQTITQGQNPTEEGEGWKVFDRTADDDGSLVGGFALYNPEYDYANSRFERFVPHFESGKWLTDQNHYQIKAERYETYQTGYHVFVNEKDAILIANAIFGIVRKVRYKNVTAKGTQNFFHFKQTFPTVVARQIFIEEKTNVPGNHHSRS